MENLTNDFVIRQALTNELMLEKLHDPSTIIVPEVEICMGYARADMMMVNGVFHGYEIKSDRDTLDRLTHQIGFYEQVFEEITIVCGEKHLEEVLKKMPSYWGVILAKYDDNQQLELEKIRASNFNEYVDKYSLVQILWRQEALEELQTRGLDKGVRSKPRNAIWERLADSIDVEELFSVVRRVLKQRENWRTVEKQE